MKLLDLLKLPEAKEIHDLDSALTSDIHREIILKKPFLKRLYLDFYKEFKKASINLPKGDLVEIGSGGGFLKEVIPGVVTADIFSSNYIDIVLSKEKMPFENNSVSAFFLRDVLHHIKDPFTFFTEVNRCLVEHGKIIMIEPYNSLWGGFIYKNFHHEPFDINATWEITGDGRLTDANIALPWIIFFRDRKKFESRFPNLKIRRLEPHTPFRYLLSGGLSMRQFLPSFTYNLIKGFETLLSPLNRYLGMFLTIELEKISK